MMNPHKMSAQYFNCGRTNLYFSLSFKIKQEEVVVTFIRILIQRFARLDTTNIHIAPRHKKG